MANLSFIRTITTFNASKELPCDLEDALLLWMNKINQANISEYWKHKNEPHIVADKKVRLHKNHLVEKTLFPYVSDVNSCFKDGKTLLSLLIFYYPDLIAINSKFCWILDIIF